MEIKSKTNQLQRLSRVNVCIWYFKCAKVKSCNSEMNDQNVSAEVFNVFLKADDFVGITMKET